MPIDDYPILNKSYATYITAAGVLAGGFFVYIGIFNSADSATSIFFIIMALFVATGSIFVVYRASRLRMNDEGLSSGENSILWRDVTDVRRVGYGIHFNAGDRRIVVAPYAYENPDELIQFVEKALAKVK